MTIGRRIMDGLRRLSDEPQPQAERVSRLIVSDPIPPAVSYVNALLTELVATRGAVTLRASERLPVPAGERANVPVFALVMNRLKVLSGLDPIVYPQAITGKFDFTVRDRTVRIATTFDDGQRDPWCRVAVADGSVETGSSSHKH